MEYHSQRSIVHPRDVVCPVCGAKKARACVGVYTGRWHKQDGRRVAGEPVHFARLAEAGQ
jgi:hypothetical protein